MQSLDSKDYVNNSPLVVAKLAEATGASSERPPTLGNTTTAVTGEWRKVERHHAV